MGRKIYKIICENCGKTKETTKKTQKFCCFECSVDYRIKNNEKIKIIDGKEYKKCGICNKYYPLNLEYFRRDRDSFYCNCKKCENEKRKYKYHNDKNFRKMILSYDKNKKKQMRRNYYLLHRELEIKRAKEYNEKHKEELKIKSKIYRKTEKGIESNKIKCHKRRKNLKNKGNFTLKEWEICKNFFKNNKGNYICAYCNKEIQRPTIEHFIPISNGGLNVKENILPICNKCNCSKQDSNFLEWYKKQSFYNQENILKINKYFEYIKTTPSHE